jgi:PAS domain S-box-containing protein
MLTTRLPYKFLLLFLAFSIVLIVPFSVFTYFDSDKLVRDMDDIRSLTAAQKAVYSRYTDNMIDNIVSYSFYIFVIAFILAMFFSHSLLVPVKELYKGARSLRDGELDIRLNVTTVDELGEVTNAFNDMVTVLRKNTNELMRKDHYVSAMLDPLWVVDEDNIIMDINPAFTGLFGYEREDVIGSSVFDFLDEKGERVLRRKLFEREEGISSSYEVSIISKTEGLIPVLISGSPVIEGGEVVCKIGIIKDFREQLALREALKEEKEKTDAIMDSMMDQLLVIDRDYRVMRANVAVRANIGRDVRGERCHEAMHGREKSCFMSGDECPVKVAFETGKSFSTIHEQGTGAHKSFHEVVAYPLKDKHGEVKHAVEIIRDVTERKKFEDEIELRNRELTTLNSISRILSQSLRAEDIFSKVLDRIIGLVGMDGGAIFFLDEMGRELNCRFHRGLSEDFVNSIARMKVGDDIPGKVALGGQGFLSPDVSRDHRAAKSLLRHSGIKGFACIPIKGKEKLLGVFVIFSFRQHIFSDGEERTLNSISEMMGIAFENIRLYEKMRGLFENNRRRRAEEQKNLLNLSSMLTTTLDMKNVLASSLSLLKESSRADFVWLLEIDEDGNLLIRSTSEQDECEGEVVYAAGTNSIEKYIIDKKEPMCLPDITSESRFFLSDRLQGYVNICCLPMFIGEKSIGAITLYYGSRRVTTEEEIFFLQTVASVLAVALERAKLYENVMLQRGMSDTILESIADGVVTVDNGGRIISMNSAAGEIIGVTPFTMTGAKMSGIFGESRENMEFGLKIEECFEGALKGDLMSAEVNLVLADGRRLPIMFRSAPVRDNTGNIAGVVYIIRDLSGEVELNMMKTDLVKSVSHEFRSPLTAIVGMTEMVLEGEVDGARAKGYLHTILSEGRRLSDMVSDVLDIARIESGKEVLKESVIDFNSLVRYVKEAFATVIEKKEVKFSSSVDDIIGYKGDEDKLKQLLRNLVDNSLTYSDKGCSVELNVGRHDDSVRIQVKDNGWGMEDEDLEHVGEKFYRSKSAAGAKGTGLGFSLCGSIALTHGGKMEVHSKKGKGTTVAVELPMRRDDG